jgi:hypothetical protein
MTTVLEAMIAAFPEYTLDARDASDLALMPVNSTCGEDCIKAIDAGKVLADAIRAAHYDTIAYRMVQPVAKTVSDLCLLYICG